MTRGRKPRSDHLRLIRQPSASAETVPASKPRPAKTIKAPGWVRGAVAKREFERVAAELIKASRWSPLFVNVIGQYAESHQRYRWAMEQLDRDSLIVMSPNNYPIQAPMLAVANKERAFMLQVAGEMGFTLVSAVRVATAQLDLFAPADDTAPAEGTGTGNPFSDF